MLLQQQVIAAQETLLSPLNSELLFLTFTSHSLRKLSGALAEGEEEVMPFEVVFMLLTKTKDGRKANIVRS